MERVYQEAFAEVDEILKIMPIELLSKIPIRFREVISENKAKDYKVEINEDFEEEKLKEETIVILGLIYRDFLASPDEREELQLKDAEELKRIEELQTKRQELKDKRSQGSTEYWKIKEELNKAEIELEKLQKPEEQEVLQTN